MREGEARPTSPDQLPGASSQREAPGRASRFRAVGQRPARNARWRGCLRPSGRAKVTDWDRPLGLAGEALRTFTG